MGPRTWEDRPNRAGLPGMLSSANMKCLVALSFAATRKQVLGCIANICKTYFLEEPSGKLPVSNAPGGITHRLLLLEGVDAM